MNAVGEQSWPDVAAEVLLVPLGSTEQHGPHLPLDTDTRIAVAVAERVAARRSGVVVSPALPFGASGEHAGFPGTLSIGTEALHHVLIELVRSAAETFGTVVFVNGHGGNHAGVTSAVEQLVHEGHSASAWWPRVPGGDAHAGHTETSLLLAIAPEVVRLDLAEAGNTDPVTDLMPAMRDGGVKAVSPNGVLGDPTGASAEVGEQLLAALVADVVASLPAAQP